MCYNTENKMNKRGWIKKRFIPLLALLLVVAIVVGLHFFYGRHPERVIALQNHLYWGAFLASLIGNATIILPMPGMLLIFALGAVFNPVMVGLVAAVGGTIGEVTGYMLGHSGRRLLPSNKIFIRIEKCEQRRFDVILRG